MKRNSYKRNKIKIFFWGDEMSRKDLKKRTNRLTRRENKRR